MISESHSHKFINLAPWHSNHTLMYSVEKALMRKRKFILTECDSILTALYMYNTVNIVLQYLTKGHLLYTKLIVGKYISIGRSQSTRLQYHIRIQSKGNRVTHKHADPLPVKM